MINKLYGEDWIALWHRILEEEIELANKPDEEFELPGVGVDEESGGRGNSFTGSSPGTPNRPGGPPGRRQPPARRRPPGPGG
jgi:hypothetical protein